LVAPLIKQIQKQQLDINLLKNKLQLWF
jgi:hypothetical protein